MKRILISLSIIAAVAAIAIGGTVAWFSDTETSTGNTFTAGVIDIELDDQDEHFGFNRCVQFTTQAACDQEPNCEWDNTANVCKEIAPDSVTKTFVVKDWKPSQIWNPGMLSIHNKGTNPIGQVMLWASMIDDTDDGAKPESEPANLEGQGGGDLMADDVEIVFVEQWLWSANDWKKENARDKFMELARQLLLVDRVPPMEDINRVLQEVNQILGGSLRFVDLTPNFIRVYDQLCGNKNNIVTLDELAKGKKNILGDPDGTGSLTAEVLDPSEVKIIIPHFHFASLADNDLQGDVVKFDLTIEGYQVGADPMEGCIEEKLANNNCADNIDNDNDGLTDGDGDGTLETGEDPDCK